MLQSFGLVEKQGHFGIHSFRGEIALKQFGNDLTSGNQVDQAVERNPNQILTNDPGQIRDLKDCDEGGPQQCRFQSGCPTGNYGKIRVPDGIISIIFDQREWRTAVVRQNPSDLFAVQAGGSWQQELNRTLPVQPAGCLQQSG